MGSRCKIDKIDSVVESSPLIRVEGNSPPTTGTMSHRMTKESNQRPQIGEQAIIMMEDHAVSSTIELPCIVQSPLERPNAFNTH